MPCFNRDVCYQAELYNLMRIFEENFIFMETVMSDKAELRERVLNLEVPPRDA